MFIGGFVTGVITTVFLGPGLPYIFYLLRRIPKLGPLIDTVQPPDPVTPAVRLDHVVVRTRSSDDLAQSVDFWMRNFGLESERLEEAGAFIRDPENQSPAFPSVRINEGTVLDLFPVEMKSYFCKESLESAVVDHICLTVPGWKMAQILANFAENGVPISAVVGDFVGRENGGSGEVDGEFYGPWGAMGRGISVYFHEPNGLYCEVRTYDLDSVKEIRERALQLIRQPDRPDG